MARTGRPKSELVVSEDERAELVRLTRRAQVNRQVAFRARVVLACADWWSDTDVAKRHRTTNQTVGKWRRRFIEMRLDGLYDEPRVGAPRTISDEQVEAVVVRTLETNPKGETHWSTRSMAKKAGMSHSTARRVEIRPNFGRPVLVHAAAAAFIALLAGLSIACSVPIAGGLDDSEANRAVVALERARVGASKELDPTVEGKWRVEVGRDDLPQALAVLRDEELPRVHPPGVLDALGKGALVPSEAAERAQLMAGIAGELEQSLQGVDGILSARVHLNVPAPSPLRDVALPHASASVLLTYRGATPPLSTESVQRLVAGGVGALLPSDVAVVLVARPAPPMTSGNELGHVGPIAVARASVRTLQAALAVLVAMVMALAAAILALYARLTRLRLGTGLVRGERGPLP
jgi:type III secretion system YscJ/HrcJ family lipoprotein